VHGGPRESWVKGVRGCGLAIGGMGGVAKSRTLRPSIWKLMRGGIGLGILRSRGAPKVFDGRAGGHGGRFSPGHGRRRAGRGVAVF
jgi:hypothetical protein